MKKTRHKYNRLLIIISIISILYMYISCTYTQATFYENKYVVKPGDSLWKIAASFNDNNNNILEDIYRIKKDNNLNNSNLEVGQVLIIKKRLASND